MTRKLTPEETAVRMIRALESIAVDVRALRVLLERVAFKGPRGESLATAFAQALAERLARG